MSRNKRATHEKTSFYNPWAETLSFNIHLFPVRECGTAGALVLKPFNIHLFPLRECGTAGVLVLGPFNIHLFPLRECGTAGALVLKPFNIHLFPLRDCGSTSFTPNKYSELTDCRSAGAGF